MRNSNLFTVKYTVEGDNTPHYASGSAPCTKIDYVNGVYSEAYVLQAAESYVTVTMEINGQKGKFEILEFEFPEDNGHVFE